MRIVPLILFFLTGCMMPLPGSQPRILTGKVLLTSDTHWQGEVIIDGAVTVVKGVTLRIEPGTNIRFVRRDADRDGLGDATIIVKGSLIAVGTESRPIRFLSAETDPQPADWLEIRSDFARQLLFDWCEFRDSAYTLHAHFTRGHIRNSYIHHNIDGSRLGRSRFLFQYNLVEQNTGKGINFRDSEVTLIDNIIRDNRTGIFLFEKPGTSVISRNNIYRNGVNLQLGDFFNDNISVSNNWWGESELALIAQSIHDHEDDAELGMVRFVPALSWRTEAGIQHTAAFKPLWQVATEGFVDSSAETAAGLIYFASWDGALRAVDQAGRVVWTTPTGDVIDAGLLMTEGQIFLQNWRRELHAIDQKTGRDRLIYTYSGSPADDHRQAGLVATDKLLLLPAWNGTLYAFERKTEQLQWSFAAGMPLRAKPLVADGVIYQPSGARQLTALDLNGQLLWQHKMDAPLITTPVAYKKQLLLLDKMGTLTSLADDGALRWQRRLKQAAFYATPLLVKDALYLVTASGTIRKIDPVTGRDHWSFSLGASVYASPVACAAGLLVGDNDGVLHLIDFDSGRTLARYRAGGAIQSRVLVTGNRLYFGSRDQKLHALQLVQPAPKGDGSRE
ncbi:MAG: PQQ-binding-like beta-propeller repeat protein [Geopsychrobacter sp.]|nr:PQQ-binding-like beta-propeller repeat protein [Geopsychrobacter sp.]